MELGVNHSLLGRLDQLWWIPYFHCHWFTKRCIFHHPFGTIQRRQQTAAVVCWQTNVILLAVNLSLHIGQLFSSLFTQARCGLVLLAGTHSSRVGRWQHPTGTQLVDPCVSAASSQLSRSAALAISTQPGIARLHGSVFWMWEFMIDYLLTGKRVHSKGQSVFPTLLPSLCFNALVWWILTMKSQLRS
jgi:hypothetical protein